MKANSTTTNRFWLFVAIGLALYVLVISPQSTPAQTNTFPSTGNVGIGTTTPGEKLEVTGNVKLSGTITAGSGPTTLTDATGKILSAALNTVAVANGGTGGTTAATGRSGLGLDTANTPQFALVGLGTAAVAGIFVRASASSNSNVYGLHITNSSNGSGASVINKIENDAGALSYYGIAGSAYSGFAPFDGGKAFFGGYQTDVSIFTQTAKDIIFYTNVTEAMRVKSGGNVGIGTMSPGYKLDVNGAVNATGLNINGSPVAGSQWATTGANIGYTAGNVAIGSGTPTTPLHVFGNGTVTGNLTVGGNIAAKYQDVAEWVPASEQIPFGTVVILDSTKSNHVIQSAQSYDTRVAGVVSAQPGIALGEVGVGKVLVATTGRVLVQVDASRGAIHIGDLLVTSDIPGAAMKSEPIQLGGRSMHMPGTLIGKALEPLEKGSGKILVLLSLQ